MLAYLITIAIILFFFGIIWSTESYYIFMKIFNFFLASFAFYEILNITGKISMKSEPNSIVLLSVIWFIFLGIICKKWFFFDAIVKTFLFVLGIWGIVILL